MNINSNRVITGFAAGVCALAILPGSVQAQAPLSLSSATAPLSLNGAPVVGGTLDASLLNQPYSSADLNGTLSTWVIAGNVANPLGGLTFVYQISNSGPDPVTGLGIQGSWGGPTFVGNNFVGDNPPGGGDLLPELASAAGAFTAAWYINPGNVIDFSFTNTPPKYFPVFGGSNSCYLVVDTSATSYGQSTADLTGNADPNAADLAPTPGTVPEAGFTLMLLVTALSGIACLGRKVTG